MKKLFYLTALILFCVCLTLGLSSCQVAPWELFSMLSTPAYYGDYYSVENGEIKKLTINKDGIIDDGITYKFTEQNDYITTEDDWHIRFYENYNVLVYEELPLNPDIGYIYTRNGFFSMQLIWSNPKEVLTFNSDGTFVYRGSFDVIMGLYTLSNGVLALNGYYYRGGGQMYQTYIYVTTTAGKMYRGVYLKDNVIPVGDTESQNQSGTESTETESQSQEITEYVTLTYECNAEEGYIDGQTSQNVVKGDNANQVTAIANDGYEFVGWSDGLTSATRQDLSVLKNLAVSAVFNKIEYVTLTYNYNNGEANSQVELEKNSNVKLPAPQRLGYTFMGWDVNGNRKQSGTAISVAYNMTIYAVWEVDVYTITYNLNGGKLNNAKIE